MTANSSLPPNRTEIRAFLEQSFAHFEVRCYENQQIIELHNLPKISWFVGPNGSGKSKALTAIYNELNRSENREHGFPVVALIRTERVSAHLIPSAQENRPGVERPKTDYMQLLSTAHQHASVNAAIALLDRDIKLQIRVLATMQQILGREVRLDYFNGELIPSLVDSRTNIKYEFRNEAQGLLELLTLLTYTYCDKFDALFIDEPELSLHPQHQAFLLEELRRSNKWVILVTHSPFMMNVQKLEDLRGIVCFHTDGRPPSQIQEDADKLDKIVTLLTEDKSVLFFAEQPVFCEGANDSLLIASLYRALGMGVAPSGFPISMTGSGNVLTAVRLAHYLGKRASAILDQDVILEEQIIQTVELIFVSNEKSSDARMLQTALAAAIDKVIHLIEPVEGSQLHKIYVLPDVRQKRIKMLLAITKRHPELQITTLQEVVTEVFQAFNLLRGYLAEVRLFVLPRGSLEHHMPSFSGDILTVTKSDKKEVLQSELEWLQNNMTGKIGEINNRYPELVSIVEQLPIRNPVNLESVIQTKIAEYLFPIITAIREGRLIYLEQPLESILPRQLLSHFKQMCSISKLEISSRECFCGTIAVDNFDYVISFDETTDVTDRSKLRMTKHET
jgi:hypothetical protein